MHDGDNQLMAPSRITCLLVDDHPAVLRALGAALQEDGIDVIGRAERGVQALALLERRKPAVALVDLHLPDGSGIELIRGASKLSPTTACLVYTGLADAADVQDSFDAGARGVISKEAPLSEVSRAIAVVVGGGTYVDALFGRELAASRSGAPVLTGRERDVLCHLADGLSNEEVGKLLHLSGETVRGYVRSATARLGARNRTHAVATAVRMGLVG